MRTPTPDSDDGRRIGLLWALTLLPWTWFLVRNVGVGLDPIAVVLPALAFFAAAALALAAILLRRWAPAVVALSFVVFAVFAVGAPRLPERSAPPAGAISLASANTYRRNAQPGAASAALVATGADVLVAVETTSRVQSALAARDTDHPYVASTAQLMLRSRFPIQQETLPRDLPSTSVMRVRVDAPGEPIVVYVVHAPNPLFDTSFGNELQLVQSLQRSASVEGLPVVIAGDLNLSDRTIAYRVLDGSFLDAMRTGGWASDTFDRGIWKLFFLRIDHVFVSRSWCAADPSRFDVPGSDHSGISVSLGACPPASSA